MEKPLAELLADLAALDTQISAADAKIEAILQTPAGQDGNLNDDQTLQHNQLVEERNVAAASRKTLVRKIRLEQDRLGREEERAALEAAATAQKTAVTRAGRQVAEGRRLTDADIPAPPLHVAAAPAAGQPLWAEPKKYGSIRWFQGTRAGRTAEQRAYRFGMWALARMAEDVPNRFGKVRLFQEATDWVKKNLAVSSNDASGYQYLIPVEFSADIIDLREKFGVARQLFKLEPMVSDTKRVPRRRGGLTAAWTSEGGVISESNKTWDDVELVAKDLTAISRASTQVTADSIVNWGDDLAKEIAYAFAYSEDQAAFNGDGTSTYGRIVGVRTKLNNVDGANNASVGLVTGSGSSWAGLVIGDFEAVVGTLPDFAAGPGACWVCHRTFFYTIMQKLQTALGGVTMAEAAVPPMGGYPSSVRPVFLGYPVTFSQVYPSTAAASQVACSFGDHSLGAMFGNRQEPEIAFSEHASIGGQSVFERNQIAIRGTERVDINVHDVGFAVANVQAASPGPICGLITHS